MSSIPKTFILILAIGVALAAPLPASPGEPNNRANSSHPNSGSHLLETGFANKLIPAPGSPEKLKAVSYNIRWRGGEELRQLAKLLREDPEVGGATILGLQEVDRNKKRTGNKNTARSLADDLGMHYAWAAPPSTKSEPEEETGVAIMSPYQLTQISRIVLPHEGPGDRRRVALGATVRIGPASLRVYSVHAENRMPVEKKLDQMRAVLADLSHYPKDVPAIILGDLNTWEPSAASKTVKLFTDEGFQTPFDGQPTFCRRILFVPLKLKLDWIWVRNLQTHGSGVDREISLSDHWPMWIILGLTTRPPSPASTNTEKT